MKRPLLIAILLLLLDQVTKYLAMTYLPGQQLIFWKYFGLTYIINPGLWINNAMPLTFILPLQLLAAVIILVVAGFVLMYRRFYRKSLWMDLFFACLLAAFFGNLVIDRLAYGFVRDFIIFPYFVANLADIYSNVMIACLAIELLSYPQARQLMHMGTSQTWRKESSFLVRFVRGYLFAHGASRAHHRGTSYPPPV